MASFVNREKDIRFQTYYKYKEINLDNNINVTDGVGLLKGLRLYLWKWALSIESNSTLPITKKIVYSLFFILYKFQWTISQDF